MKRGNIEGEPFEGKWDYDGSCDPTKGHGWGSMETFTLGCWQWVRRGKDGKGDGFKAGKVAYRIKGRVNNPQEAHDKARAFCARKQEPTA